MCIPILTQTEPIGMVCHAVAKSTARIGVRKSLEAYSRNYQRFFCACIQHTYPFYGWVVGAAFVQAGSSNAGYANPNNSATIFEIGVSIGGSYFIRGAPTMAIYRIAVLLNDNTCLSDNSVKKYLLLSASSDSAARLAAARRNAVITGWRVCR